MELPKLFPLKVNQYAYVLHFPVNISFPLVPSTFNMAADKENAY